MSTGMSIDKKYETFWGINRGWYIEQQIEKLLLLNIKQWSIKK